MQYFMISYLLGKGGVGGWGGVGGGVLEGGCAETA